MQRTRSLLRTLICLIGLIPAFNVFAGDPMQGASIYTQQCAGCHGGNGIGIIAGTPNLAGNTQLMVKPDFELMNTILLGKGIMPAFQGKLTELQVLDVIAHIRTFF